ncbi:SDR family oxidoreductase [Arthrobacter sp. H20]|uniref:SDR family oxidoreductase n=1 Tax=Arthrobacter sp. H20 TaxID=1267981 RepID=UPI00047C6088|nr:SDR family oxidoreductase [Arthrobacter sp. H20]
MGNVVAVTGSTGAVGGSTARLLSAAGISLRLLVRNPDRAPRLPSATSAQCSYADRTAALAALDGVDTLFMVSASEAKDRVDQHLAFVDAAQDSGVRHIVYTSFFAAAPDATFTLGRGHWATEEHIRRSGMDYTFLRDNFYLDVLSSFADEGGTIRGPAGSGQLAAVAREDVARVAAVVLANPSGHSTKTHELTGPQALTLPEVAAIISAETGQSVSYRSETVEEAYASRRRFGVPDWQLDAWVNTYSAIATGEMATITETVRDLTGRPTLSLTDVLRAGH